MGVAEWVEKNLTFRISPGFLTPYPFTAYFWTFRSFKILQQNYTGHLLTLGNLSSTWLNIFTHFSWSLPFLEWSWWLLVNLHGSRCTPPSRTYQGWTVGSVTGHVKYSKAYYQIVIPLWEASIFDESHCLVRTRWRDWPRLFLSRSSEWGSVSKESVADQNIASFITSWTETG